jgi:hypothetical protein
MRSQSWRLDPGATQSACNASGVRACTPAWSLPNQCRCAAQDPRTWDYFEDNRASNDTWVSVELNAGFTGVMAGMNQVPGTYDQCLQGYGILARDVNICG